MKYESRKYIILSIILVIGMVYLVRLLSMQVLTSKWEKRAADITEKKVYDYASRGVIFDRDGKRLVDNTIYHDIMVTPGEIEELDTAAFCKLLGITKASFNERMQKAKDYSYIVPSEFMKEIPQEDFDHIREELYRYEPAFFARIRSLRVYPKGIAAQVLGYLNEANKKDIKRDNYYRPGDYIGRTGIEQSYEMELRGKRGVRYLLKDAVGMESGAFAEGKYDTSAESGKNLVSTIDAELQAYGERLMQNKIGSIVAIEPKTGEVLAMVSSPTYDPNLLVGAKNRREHYPRISQDNIGKPLFNKAVQSKYPPGSIFKMFQALIGMEDGVLKPESSFYCDGSLIGDHVYAGYYQMYDAIKSSSNQWFYLATREIIQPGDSASIFRDARAGLDKWQQKMTSFGLGQRLPIELNDVYPGFIPGPEYYDKIHGKHRWAYSTIYSISIGQGEVELTPLQMANLGCVLANRGYYYYPHLVKDIDGQGKRELYTKKNYAYPDSSHYPIVIDAMRAVIEEPGGTARRARIDSITVCGKTGTAENPFGEDHSVFLAFAPMDDPKIAIAVYVENAGFGGVWAAPISALMIEKYLKGYITDERKEKRILEANFLESKENAQ